MANRSRLARSKLPEFSKWLEDSGVQLLEPKGFYEVLRWKSSEGGPMAIVYSKNDFDSMHLTLNESAIDYFNKWNRERRKTG